MFLTSSVAEKLPHPDSSPMHSTAASTIAITFIFFMFFPPFYMFRPSSPIHSHNLRALAQFAVADEAGTAEASFARCAIRSVHTTAIRHSVRPAAKASVPSAGQ